MTSSPPILIDLVFDGLAKECWLRAVRDSQDQGLRLEISTDNEKSWRDIEWPQALRYFEEEDMWRESA